MGQNGGNLGSCRSCRKAVVWAKTAHNRPIPLDAESAETRFVLEETDGHTTAVSRRTFVSHFAVCPDAEQWRKPKQEGA
jgi:hypothetical protein